RSGNEETLFTFAVSKDGGGSSPGQWLSGMVTPAKSETPWERAWPSSAAARQPRQLLVERRVAELGPRMNVRESVVRPKERALARPRAGQRAQGAARL